MQLLHSTNRQSTSVSPPPAAALSIAVQFVQGIIRRVDAKLNANKSQWTALYWHEKKLQMQISQGVKVLHEKGPHANMKDFRQGAKKCIIN